MTKAKDALTGWQQAIRNPLATEQQVNEAIRTSAEVVKLLEESHVVAKWRNAVRFDRSENSNAVSCIYDLGNLVAEQQYDADTLAFNIQVDGCGYLTFEAKRAPANLWRVTLRRVGLYPEEPGYNENTDGILTVNNSFYLPIFVKLEI